MSILPKKLIKGKDTFTTFHMRIANNSDENIIGKIIYKVTMPDGKIDIKEIGNLGEIKANSEFNRYDKYFINANAKIGRYYVDGRFLWNDVEILSDTNKEDYFDVLEEE